MTNLNKVDDFMIFNVLKNLNLKVPNFFHFEVIALSRLQAADLSYWEKRGNIQTTNFN